MKRILISAAALAVIASPAFAQVASQTTTVNLNGNVPNSCTLGAPTPVQANSAGFGALNGGGGASTVNLNLQFGMANAPQFQLSYAGMCNYAHSVGIDSNGGLVQTTPATVVGGTFVQRIGYTASVAWAGTNTAISPTTSTATAAPDTVNPVNTSIPGPNRGTLLLSFAIPQDATPVVAGDYSDVITLKIGSAL